jgi:hypothetical protein
MTRRELDSTGSMVRISANPHMFIASYNRGSALGFDFDVTRELKWADRGQHCNENEGGKRVQPSK